LELAKSTENPFPLAALRRDEPDAGTSGRASGHTGGEPVAWL